MHKWQLIPILFILASGCSKTETLQSCRITDPRITEASGITASFANPGSFWIHNDSGDAPLLYLLRQDCSVARAVMVNATAMDWEDIGSFERESKSMLVIGDFGNNDKSREVLRLLILKEPLTERAELDFEVQFRFPDFRRNVECLLLFPEQGVFQVIPKHQASPVAVYEGVLWNRKVQTLAKVGSVNVGGVIGESRMITGGATHSKSGQVAIRTYLGWYQFSVGSGRDWHRLPPSKVFVNGERTGEGITFSNDGLSLISVEEGESSILHQRSIK
jgi:hypothetical protein